MLAGFSFKHDGGQKETKSGIASILILRPHQRDNDAGQKQDAKGDRIGTLSAGLDDRQPDKNNRRAK